MSKGLYFVTFVVGAGVGGFVAWQYAKKKYEQIAQEEIDSVKEVFSMREKEMKEKAAEAPVEEKPAEPEYHERVSSLGYTTSLNTSVETSHKPPKDGPYVISPDEFGEFEDYSKFSLFYYTDKVLADDNDDPVDDVEETVGWDSLNHFGEYEDDSVFVRNDRLKSDYEILLSLKSYCNDVVQRNRRPHVVEE